MRDLGLLTWKEIREINKSKSIVFALLAPIEEHGWHLPLATDLIEGDCWSKGAMEKIEEQLKFQRINACILTSSADFQKYRKLTRQ